MIDGCCLRLGLLYLLLSTRCEGLVSWLLNFSRGRVPVLVEHNEIVILGHVALKPVVFGKEAD